MNDQKIYLISREFVDFTTLDLTYISNVPNIYFLYAFYYIFHFIPKPYVDYSKYVDKEETFQEYFNITFPCIKNELSKYANVTVLEYEMINCGNLFFEFYATASATMSNTEFVIGLYNISATCVKSVDLFAKTDKAMANLWKDCFKETCHGDTEADLESTTNLIMLGLGWFVLVVATILTRRVSFYKDKFYGRPGIVVPLNMLDSYENRFGYAAAMALSASACVAVILGSREYIIGLKAERHLAEVARPVRVFIKMMLTFLVSSIAIPFFLLQNFANKIVSCSFGFLLSLAWISLRIYTINEKSTLCEDKYSYEKASGMKYFDAFSEIPMVICLVFLASKFAKVFYKAAKQRIKTKGLASMLQNQDDGNWREGFVFKYVQKVINEKKDEEAEEEKEKEQDLALKEKVKVQIKAKAYSNNPDFSYSTRLLMGAATSISVVYIICMLFGAYGYAFFVLDIEDIIDKETLDFIDTQYDIKRKDVKNYWMCIVVSWWTALAFAILIFIFSISNSFAWYRRHVVMLRKGNRSFLPQTVNKGNITPTSLMAASMKFAGFQVAYSAWGLIITFGIFLLIMLVVTIEIFLPIITGNDSLLLWALKRLWPSLLFTLFMMIFQKVTARFVFLRDKDTLAVDNRRLFHLYSYFMFFYNIFLGIFSCLMRIIYGIILGALFLQRLQKSTLPRSFEKRDPGFMAYVGYILLENQHANPVLQCFVKLMLEESEAIKNYRKLKKDLVLSNGAQDYGSMDNKDNTIEWEKRNQEYMKKRMRNKWHLYKMLILNPSLRKYRAKPKKPDEKTLAGALQNFMRINVDEFTKKPDDVEDENTLPMEDMKKNADGSENEAARNNSIPGKLSISSSINDEGKFLINCV